MPRKKQTAVWSGGQFFFFFRLAMSPREEGEESKQEGKV